MEIYLKKSSFVVLLIIFLVVGCVESERTVEDGGSLLTKIDLGTTIGSLAEVFSSEMILVEGYGIVGGLKGAGSTECPKDVRMYLKQYILKRLPKINIEEFINSRDTAVVVIQGVIPAASSKNQHFDLKITALRGTQTTSLEGGWLYRSDLREVGGFGLATRVLASAAGPVFIDTIDNPTPNKKEGLILGGGAVLNEYKIVLAIRQPDYKIASFIRNRLIERFGDDVAKAISPGQIELKVPARYNKQKERFASIIKATYLTETPEIIQQRVRSFVGNLAVSSDKDKSEIALETIGRASVPKLSALLNSLNEEVRLRAARCLLNIGNNAGLNTLRQIATNKNSAYRIEALKSITKAASRNDAAAISRKLLQDSSFEIRLAAYEQLRKLDDIVLTRKWVARQFYLETIAHVKDKTVFVSRSDYPRIVLFGSPINCRDNIFIKSSDSNITINAPSGQRYVSIIRKHPTRPNVTIKLKSSFKLSDIIQALGGEPIKKSGQDRSGLGIPYAELIAILKQMCDKNAIDAEFRVGNLSKSAQL